MKKVKLVVMKGPWAGWLDHYRAISPRIVPVAAVTDEDLMREIVDAEVILGRPDRGAFLAAERLKWVQSIGVGFETMLYPEMLESDVVITNTSGAFDPVMGEHAMALILGYTRAITVHERNRPGRTWVREIPAIQIHGKTACVLGLGSIGRSVVARLSAFGVHVIAVDAQASVPPEGVERVFPPDRMLEAVSEADIVVVALPLTDRTRGLVNAGFFDRMKDSAYLVNIARGPIVAESDLIEALQSGRIAGAGLDVFEEEPLPDSSPLWDMPNVVITPHSASFCPENAEDLRRIFCENLRRYVGGEPLLNVVDKRLGYLVQKG
jgi:phosphoglycerate dehydrogenase-like enzyme